MGDEGADFGCAHVFRLTFLMKDAERVAANPADVGFFSAVGLVLGAEGVSELVEQFFCHRS